MTIRVVAMAFPSFDLAAGPIASGARLCSAPGWPEPDDLPCCAAAWSEWQPGSAIHAARAGKTLGPAQLSATAKGGRGGQEGKLSHLWCSCHRSSIADQVANGGRGLGIETGAMARRGLPSCPRAGGLLLTYPGSAGSWEGRGKGWPEVRAAKGAGASAMRLHTWGWIGRNRKSTAWRSFAF